MRELPELLLLCYHASRPYLRLLRLPEAVIEPSPVALGATWAVDRAIARDGWLALIPNEEVWGVPVPLEGRAFRVGGWWDCVAAPNPRTVWLANPIDDDGETRIDKDAPTQLVEYDGVRREEVRRRVLPQRSRLEAAVPDGLVTRFHQLDDASPDGLTLWPWDADRGEPLASGWDVLASSGSVLAVTGRNRELTLVDAVTRTQTPIRRPLPGAWDLSGSFSPDGAWFAISVREAYRPPPTTEDMAAFFTNLFDPDHEDAYEPVLTRLALIDCATGAVTLAEGAFDNVASTPVWSDDSRWLIFAAWFDKRLYACDVEGRPPRLTPLRRRRGRPSPLLDVTALTT